MAITVATFCNNWSLYTFLSYLPKYVNAPVSQGGMGIDLGSNAFIYSILINICSGICAGGFGVNHADLGPKYTGSLVGIAGSIGMIAAILAPIVAGFILEITNSWSSIFYICSSVLIFGGIFYLIFASASRQFN